eukprot:gene1746-1267_t
MGNASGRVGPAAKVYVGILLDNPDAFYPAGSQISGRVCLQVDEDSYRAASLNIRFIGQEATCASYDTTSTDSDGSSTSSTVYVYDSLEFLSIDVPIFMFPNATVASGCYEHPFVFHVPPGLPGKEGVKIGTYFAIEYMLEARLTLATGVAEVKNFHEVFIASPPRPVTISPVTGDPVTLDVFNCCFHRGRVSLMANMSDANVAVGEGLGIDIGLINESLSNVRSVTIALRQTGSWTAKGVPFTSVVELYHRRIRPSELVNSARVPKHRASSGSPYTAVNFLEHVGNELTHVDLECPAARSTVKGKTGSVTYTLVITAHVGFCSTKPILELPVIVYGGLPPGSAKPQVGQAFTLPPTWAPMTAPSVAIDVAPAVSI